MGKTTRTVAPNIDVTPELSAVQIAWVTGIYEGEGHCSGGYGRTIAHISQKDPEILYRVREMFGGRIEMQRVDTPRYLHIWKLYGERARNFFRTIYPELSARRKAQIEKINGLRVLGRMQRTRDKMSPERVAIRASMTPHERDCESYRNHRHKNLERVRATQRAYQARKRAAVQVPQMIQ